MELKPWEAMTILEQKEACRPHKKSLGARRARGKKYLDPKELPAIGGAIEKRARKALKRLEQQQRGLERQHRRSR